MNTETTLETTAGKARKRRWVRRIAAALALAPLFSLIAAAPAHAEIDSLNRQVIAVNGVYRGWAAFWDVKWGSGLSWTITGSVERTSRYDGWTTSIEYYLNRKLSSNTRWTFLTSNTNNPFYDTHSFGKNSGYDPTYGAWLRLCTTPPAGVKICLPPQYVTDNS
jgi:hypothetical protein